MYLRAAKKPKTELVAESNKKVSEEKSFSSELVCKCLLSNNFFLVIRKHYRTNRNRHRYLRDEAKGCLSYLSCHISSSEIIFVIYNTLNGLYQIRLLDEKKIQEKQ